MASDLDWAEGDSAPDSDSDTRTDTADRVAAAAAAAAGDAGGAHDSSDDGELTSGSSTGRSLSRLAELVGTAAPLTSEVRRLEGLVCCRKQCLVGKRAHLTQLVASLRAMSKEERGMSLLTTIAMCAAAAEYGRPAKKTKTSGRAASQVANETSTQTASPRERFQYMVPYVGIVCKEAFQMLYGISHRTLHVYRKRVRNESIAAKPHGGKQNQNHKEIDVDLLAAWFLEMASLLGEVVPVRVRMNKVDGTHTRRYYSAEDYTLLPSNCTWESLRAEYMTYLDDNYLDTVRPSESSFRHILKRSCPTIRIRSPRDQVCDQCAIYRQQMTDAPDGVRAEVFGEHLEDAKRMRVEYKQDVARSSKGHLVLIMDFAQNLTLPHTPNTPSEWYFLSLWSVSLFGVYSAVDKMHHHYLYGERKGGKGADEVCSMLGHTLKYYGMLQTAWVDNIGEDVQKAKLTIWADNAGGQNKNSYVIWFLTMLVNYGVVEEAELKFFQKGHTKNAVDRGFGSMKQHIARVSAWNMATLADAVDAANTSSCTVNLEMEDTPFHRFKDLLTPTYKKIKGIQKYQLFRTTRKNPGAVECRHRPTNEPTNATVSSAPLHTLKDFRTLWESIPCATDRELNPEKMVDMNAKIKPYVPKEFVTTTSTRPRHRRWWRRLLISRRSVESARLLVSRGRLPWTTKARSLQSNAVSLT